jgi:hypothetical protein
MAAESVQISVLLSLARDHPGKTTEEVCTLFMKPQTSAK